METPLDCKRDVEKPSQGISAGPFNLPLISIITVVFNAVATLEATIESVVKQQHSCFEYIVIDGGSSDGTLAIVEKYGASITRWVSESDSGIYDAMNKGLRMAHGKWIYYLNSGDTFFSSDVLNKIAAVLEKTSASIVVGSVLAHRAGLTTARFPLSQQKEMTARSLFGRRFCHQALFIERAAYLRYNGFDTTYPTFADFDVAWKIISNAGGLESTDLTIASFNLDGVSSDSRKSLQLYQEAEQLFRNAKEGRSSAAYLLGSLRAIAYRYRCALLTSLR